jgi:hypothetical protein
MIAIPFFVASWVCAYLAVYAVDDLEAYYRLGVASVAFMVLGWAALMVDLVWSRNRLSRVPHPRGVSAAGSGFSRHPEGGPPGSTLPAPRRRTPKPLPHGGGAAGPLFETWPPRIGDAIDEATRR